MRAPPESTTCTGFVRFVVVPSPNCPHYYFRPPDRTVRFQVLRVKVSGGDANHPGYRGTSRVNHLHRIGPVDCGSVSQASITIFSRRPDRPVGFQEHGVKIPGCNLRYTGKRRTTGIHYPYGVDAIRSGTVPQLTAAITAHRPDRAVRFQIHRVIKARGYRMNIAQGIPARVHDLNRVASIDDIPSQVCHSYCFPQPKPYRPTSNRPCDMDQRKSRLCL